MFLPLPPPLLFGQFLQYHNFPLIALDLRLLYESFLCDSRQTSSLFNEVLTAESILSKDFPQYFKLKDKKITVKTINVYQSLLFANYFRPNIKLVKLVCYPSN